MAEERPFFRLGPNGMEHLWPGTDRYVPVEPNQIPGVNDSKVQDNGTGAMNTGSTAPPNPFLCPPSPFETQLEERAAVQRDRLSSSRYAGDKPSSEWLKSEGQTAVDDSYRMMMIEEKQAWMNRAERAGDTVQFRGLCEQKNGINAQTDVSDIKSRYKVSLAAQGASQVVTEVAASGLTAPRVIYIKLRTGEPVSVATGEYLETWRDFLIPGVMPLDGARYMGLQLPDHERWLGPLGPCQISAFDEYISNPKPRVLAFHQADGKRIQFERPFNFLPAANATCPHLELTAPWLKQLVLKDRRIRKFFKQYDDTFYRLEKIEDLNGDALTFARSDAGVLTEITRSDGLKLVFDNDARGRRTAIHLIGIDGTKLELARYAYDHFGRVILAECTYGMSARYEWHETKPLLMRWNNRTRRSQTWFTYDDAGRVIHTKTTGLWNGDRFRYDRDKRVTTYLPAGDEARSRLYEYDENENVTAEIDALGGKVAHTFNKLGFKTSTTDANGGSDHVTYDIWGNVKQHTDAEGRRTLRGWGPEGQLDLVAYEGGAKERYKYDSKANCILAINPDEQETRFERDAQGRLIRTVFPDGTTEQRSYEEHGWLASITDSRGSVTRFGYDGFGRLIESTDPLGRVTRLDYAAGAGGFATPTTLTRPDGAKVTRGFDAEGALASVTDGEGRRWTYRHSAFDVLEEITDPRGGKLKLDYDSEGRLIAVTNALGRIYELRRDVAGRIIEECDFDDRLTRYKRDAGGRVTETTKPDDARLVYTYDKTNLITRIDAFAPDGSPQDVVTYHYDDRGQLIEARNNAARVEYIRDECGRIIEEDINGRRIKSEYDECGRRIERRVFSGIDQPHETRIGEHLISYGYDPLGLIASIAIEGHAPLSFKSDALGRETRRESAAGFRLDSAYDMVGLLIRQKAGRAGKEANVTGSVFGVASATVAPQAQINRAYEWDKASSPLAIIDAIWGETRFTYDNNGQISEAEFTEEGYSEGQFGEAGTSGRQSEKFIYDDARNVLGVRAEGFSGASGASASKAVSGFFGWTSSPGGVVQIARGPHGEKVFLTHDACGRVVERKVERDGFRPKTWRYRWGAFDRLIGCTTPDGEIWDYMYDPFGRRLTKARRLKEAESDWARRKFPKLAREPAIEHYAHFRAEPPPGASINDDKPPIVGTAFSWDGDVLSEDAPLRLGGEIDWENATRWYFEPGTFRPLAKQEPPQIPQPGEEDWEPTAGLNQAPRKRKLLYIITDHLGTPREMCDEKGDVQWATSYTTWGVVRGLRKAIAANDNGTFSGLGAYQRSNGNLALKPALEEAAYDCAIRFQGQWQDAETGLYYNRHRHYDALVGQYASPDPIGLEGGLRPQGYVTSPSIWVDPLGLTFAFETNKFTYLFGGVTFDENAPENANLSESQRKKFKHNADRSAQNLKDLARIGIPDTAEGKAMVVQQLARGLRNPVISTRETIVDGVTHHSEVRQVPLTGPNGTIPNQATYEILPDGTRRLTTTIPGKGY